jgi:hypothetical protein
MTPFVVRPAPARAVASVPHGLTRVRIFDCHGTLIEGQAKQRLVVVAA